VRRANLIVFVPAALLLLILGVDLIQHRAHTLLVWGVLDESAHVATAVLALLSCRPLAELLRCRKVVAVLLASAVLIDLDHIPLYAGVPEVAMGGRPFSHSLLTVVLLVVLAVALPAGRRQWALAAAAGLVLHFVRDVATGPGLLLVWPISDRDVVLPYRLYVSVLLGLVILATARLTLHQRMQVTPRSTGR
jgi:inner membrane protein